MSVWPRGEPLCLPLLLAVFDRFILRCPGFVLQLDIGCRC